MKYTDTGAFVGRIEEYVADMVGDEGKGVAISDAYALRTVVGKTESLLISYTIDIGDERMDAVEEVMVTEDAIAYNVLHFAGKEQVFQESCFGVVNEDKLSAIDCAAFYAGQAVMLHKFSA